MSGSETENWPFFTSIFGIPCSIFDIRIRKKISNIEQGMSNDEGDARRDGS
jgi:hypothetical protein